MNDFAWITIVMLAFVFLGAVLCVARWILDRLMRLRPTFAAVLQYAYEFAFCCAMGLLATLVFYWGFEADAAADAEGNAIEHNTTISTR